MPAAAARPRPRYALLLAGGLRSFLATWPSTVDHVLSPNGKRDDWWLGLAASRARRARNSWPIGFREMLFPRARTPSELCSRVPDAFRRGVPRRREKTVSERRYDAETQEPLAAAARGLAARHAFDFARVAPENSRETKRFYAGLPKAAAAVDDLGGGAAAARRAFAFQWEAVRRVWEAFDAANVSCAWIVRTRPDVLVAAPLRLDETATMLRAAGKDALVPCPAMPSAPKRLARRPRGKLRLDVEMVFLLCVCA